MIELNYYTALRIIDMLSKLNYSDTYLLIAELQNAINNPVKTNTSNTYNGLIYTNDMDYEEEDKNKSKIGLVK